MEILYISISVVILIILFGLFYYYYWIPNQSNISKYKINLITDEISFDETYTNTISLQTQVTNRKTLYIPKLGYGLSFVWDMYIPSLSGNDKWQTTYNRIKPIISMQDSPVIAYHPKKNYLSIVLKYRNNPFYAQFAEIKFEDIKLQKWVKYIIVIENRNISMYVDGILSSTKILPSIISIGDLNTDIVLGEENNNFLGKIRNLTLYPYPLAYNEIGLI